MSRDERRSPAVETLPRPDDPSGEDAAPVPRRNAGRGIAGPAVAIAAVSGLAAVIAMATDTGLAVDAWLSGIGAVVAWVLLRTIRAHFAADPAGRFDEPETRTVDAAAAPADLLAIEWMVMDAELYGQFGFDRLRRLLWDTARATLVERRGLDPDVEPEAARGVLGDEVWDLLRPAAHESPGPVSRAPGSEPSRAVMRGRVRQVIEVMEGL